MSAIERGRWIACDGKDCREKALAVVALRPPQSAAQSAPHSTQGWLFVHEGATIRHFCPRCAALYLKALTDGERKPQCQDERHEETGAEPPSEESVQ